MKEALKTFISIRNLAIKTILVVLGLVVEISAFYPFILSKLYLTDRVVPVWVTTDTVLAFGGFFLAAGAAFYNKMADAIISKFN